MCVIGVACLVSAAAEATVPYGVVHVIPAVFGAHVDPANEFAVTTEAGPQALPAIWGDWVTWYSDETHDIWAKNLSSSETIRLTTSWPSNGHPAMYGTRVVWAGEDNNIYSYDLSTRTESTLYAAPGDRFWPEIHGDVVVWGAEADETGLPTEVWAYSITQDTAFLVSGAPGRKWYPDVVGDIVVWGDFRNGNWDIYGYDIASGTEFPVATSADAERHAAVDGSTVVFSTNASGLGCYDLTSGTCTYLGVSGRTDWPAIHGNTVVWGDYRPALETDIYGYDLVSGAEFVVCGESGWQYSPAIYGNVVVWSDERAGGFESRDIYGNTIVPESSVVVVVGLGALGLMARKRR